jgi:hypothetical protein
MRTNEPQQLKIKIPHTNIIAFRVGNQICVIKNLQTKS